MLKTYVRLGEIDFTKLMDVYYEGNRENAQDRYHNDDMNLGILKAEQDFYQYLREVFFREEGAVYAVWEEKGMYISALRLEPYADGLLLAALETHPEYRRKGYAKKLIEAVLLKLKDKGIIAVYSHINKRNTGSLQTHISCGFQRISEQATYIDGSVTSSSCTMAFYF
jgi:GNAT superfamily N-acetyltransferase